jgi:hypothetical protein
MTSLKINQLKVGDSYFLVSTTTAPNTLLGKLTCEPWIAGSGDGRELYARFDNDGTITIVKHWIYWDYGSALDRENMFIAK